MVTKAQVKKELVDSLYMIFGALMGGYIAWKFNAEPGRSPKSMGDTLYIVLGVSLFAALLGFAGSMIVYALRPEKKKKEGAPQ